MRNWRTLILMISMLSLFAVACGGAEEGAEEVASEAGDAAGSAESEVEDAAGDDAASEEMTEEMTEGMSSEMSSEGGASEDMAAADLTGEVIVSGSSTVEPITALQGELFAAEAPGVTVSVDGPGTGDGFELFCNGETDISDASRAIEPEEVEACEANGIEFIELQVAIDGITMLTNPANDAITCLDATGAYALVGPESEGFANWSDATGLAEEVGSAFAADFPDAPLDITAPGTESGTYDSFIELTFEGLAEERGQEPTTRPDYNASADDNIIIEGIIGSESSFGWVGYAFFEENQDAVKAIEYQGEGGECVAPTTETIADGSYELSRPLFIYVAAESAERPEVQSFVDFYVDPANLETAVTETGYVQSPDDVTEEMVSTWESKETGAAAAEEPAAGGSESEAASEASSEAASESSS